MDYKDSLEYIFSPRTNSTRLGLERTRELLSLLGEPQKDTAFIHVAGSNGKGSVCAMLSSVLHNAGLKCGLYTSPELEKVNERIKIDGKDISDNDFALLISEIADVCEDMPDRPSQFEMVTAAAFLYFKRNNCDIAVIEVGLGGSLDSTNVIPSPEVAVIAALTTEHMDYLGNTLAEIADKKAGIIKPGTRVVIYDNPPEANKVVSERCTALGVPCNKLDFSLLTFHSSSLEGQFFSYKEYHELFLPLLGEHQLKNAALVLETVSELNAKGYDISHEAVRTGLKNTVWPARFEVLCREPLFILDGGHNPQCISALVQAIDCYVPGEKCTFLLGVLKDKDYKEMIRLLSPYAARFICTQPDNPRALSSSELCEYLKALGNEAIDAGEVGPSVLKSLQEAVGSPIIACGSLYMAGAIRRVFGDSLKKFHRKRIISQRRSLAYDESARLSEIICSKINSSMYFEKASRVLIYNAVRGEVELSYLTGSDKEYIYPLCCEDNTLRLLAPKDPDSWRSGPFGIPEPDPDSSVEYLPGDIDLVICPLCGFDSSCARLGMGGGYYDRLLPLCKNAHIIAAAYEFQRLESVPVQEHDIYMDAIFTEEHVYIKNKP